MGLATPPEFRQMDVSSPEYVSALTTAGSLLEKVRTSFCAYPRHDHEAVVVAEGQGLIERLVVVDGKSMLKVFPIEEARARELGKPSVWAFAPGENGKADIYVLRYTDHVLFKGKRIDVDSTEFQAELRRMANAFVAEGIHELLELNLAGYLFPPPMGMLTRERTHPAGYHLVDHAPIPLQILAGDWKLAACFAFLNRQPVVTGWCAGSNSSGDGHDSGVADEIEEELAGLDDNKDKD